VQSADTEVRRSLRKAVASGVRPALAAAWYSALKSTPSRKWREGVILKLEDDEVAFLLNDDKNTLYVRPTTAGFGRVQRTVPAGGTRVPTVSLLKLQEALDEFQVAVVIES
jgi:hypothetical protein